MQHFRMLTGLFNSITFPICRCSIHWVSILCGMQNAECEISTMYNLRNIRCGKSLQNLVYFVTKIVVCYLLNKRMATFTIVPYCQQIAEHSALVIPQSIRGRIPHSIFRIPQSILTRIHYLKSGFRSASTVQY